MSNQNFRNVNSLHKGVTLIWVVIDSQQLHDHEYKYTHANVTYKRAEILIPQSKKHILIIQMSFKLNNYLFSLIKLCAM